MVAVPDAPLSTEGRRVVILSSILVTCGWIMFVLRAISSHSTAGRIRSDFLFIIGAILLSTAAYIFEMTSISKGLGHHIADLELVQIEQAMHWGLISLVFHIAGGVAAKLSIIAMLIPVQGIMATKRTMFLMGMGIVQIIINSVLIICIINSCSPVPKLWDPFLPGTCKVEWFAGRFSYFQASVSALCDFILGFWPLSMIGTLQISRKSKICFCVLMGIGVVPGISCIIRIFKTKEALASFDYTYAYIALLTWGSVEVWGILILGSVAPLRPFAIRVFEAALRAAGLSRTTVRSIPNAPVGKTQRDTDDVNGISVKTEIHGKISHLAAEEILAGSTATTSPAGKEGDLV